NADAIFTTVALMPFQTEYAVCFIADQIWEAAFLILFQILAASDASCEKFPVTRSISRSTGARITFFSSSKVPEAMSQIPDQMPQILLDHDDCFRHRIHALTHAG